MMQYKLKKCLSVTSSCIQLSVSQKQLPSNLLLAKPLSHHSHDKWRCAQSYANSNRCKYFMDCISDHERAGAGACFAGECRITPSEAFQQGHHVYSASFWGFLSPP